MAYFHQHSTQNSRALKALFLMLNKDLNFLSKRYYENFQ